MANYSMGRELPAIKDGHVFENDNFSQAVPGTEIFKGMSGLVFKKCNLVNCKVPADTMIEDCNISQVSRCSHLNPDFSLPKCPKECRHMVAKEEIGKDGQVIDTIYSYKDGFI